MNRSAIKVDLRKEKDTMSGDYDDLVQEAIGKLDAGWPMWHSGGGGIEAWQQFLRLWRDSHPGCGYYEGIPEARKHWIKEYIYVRLPEKYRNMVNSVGA